MSQHGNYNGHHKGSHILQHEFGMSHSGHGMPNLIHNFDGTDHEYGVHGQGDVYGAGNTHRIALTRRSSTDVTKGPVSAQAKSSEGANRNKFETTGIPPYVQYFHDPGLRQAIVVSG